MPNLVIEFKRTVKISFSSFLRNLNQCLQSYWWSYEANLGTSPLNHVNILRNTQMYFFLIVFSEVDLIRSSCSLRYFTSLQRHSFLHVTLPDLNASPTPVSKSSKITPVCHSSSLLPRLTSYPSNWEEKGIIFISTVFIIIIISFNMTRLCTQRNFLTLLNLKTSFIDLCCCFPDGTAWGLAFLTLFTEDTFVLSLGRHCSVSLQRVRVSFVFSDSFMSS